MESGLDLSQFFDTFFDEADELLEQMEQSLLALDVRDPDQDQLQAIFRAAHSIKGGASTFGCFQALAQTTHLLESLLDDVRSGRTALRQDMVDVFLQTKDALAGLVAAYRASEEPDAQLCARVCAQLHALTADGRDDATAAIAPGVAKAPAAVQAGKTDAHHLPLCVTLSKITDKDAQSLLAEMALLGDILHAERTADSQTIWLRTTASASAHLAAWASGALTCAPSCVLPGSANRPPSPYSRYSSAGRPCSATLCARKSCATLAADCNSGRS